MGIEHAQEKDVCGNYVILVQSSCLKEKRKKIVTWDALPSSSGR